MVHVIVVKYHISSIVKHPRAATRPSPSSLLGAIAGLGSLPGFKLQPIGVCAGVLVTRTRLLSVAALDPWLAPITAADSRSSHIETALRNTASEPYSMAASRKVTNGIADRGGRFVDVVAPTARERLERVVVRLLEVADRCPDTRIEHELMRLADELVQLIEA